MPGSEVTVVEGGKKFANTIEVRDNGFTIDGEEFPFLVEVDHEIRYEYDGSGDPYMGYLTVTIIAENLVVTDSYTERFGEEYIND